MSLQLTANKENGAAQRAADPRRHTSPLGASRFGNIIRRCVRQPAFVCRCC
jgi:hypothetical protein